jgi:hypothetical protein
MAVERQEVVVVNVKIPFWSMIVLLVKWTLASIPAIVILFTIASLLSMLFDGVLHWNMMGGKV